MDTWQGWIFFVLAAITHIRIMDPQDFYFSLPFLLVSVVQLVKSGNEIQLM